MNLDSYLTHPTLADMKHFHGITLCSWQLHPRECDLIQNTPASDAIFEGSFSKVKNLVTSAVGSFQMEKLKATSLVK